MHKLLLSCFILVALTSAGQTKKIDSLEHVLATAQGAAKAKVLIELCGEYRMVNSDSARNFGLAGLQLARDLKLEILEVEALHNIGITLEAQGKYNEALAYELPALELRMKIGDDAKTANTYNNLGIIYDETGNAQLSLEYYYKARKIYEKLKDDSKIAMVISNIAIVLKGQREYQKAIPYYHEALAIYVKQNNAFGIAACHANLGSVYLFVEQYDSALFYSQLSSSEFREQKNYQFLPTTLSNSAQSYIKTNQLKKAEINLLEAKQLNTEFDNQFDLAEVEIVLASVYRGSKHFTDAFQAATRGLQIGESIQAPKLIMDARLELSAIEEARGNTAAALVQYKLYDAQEDSLFQQDNARQVAELQTQYETERKEKEISVQKLQLQEQDSLLKRRQLTIVALVVVLALAIFVFLLIRSRQKLKAQKENEERNRIHQQELTRSVIELQERERERFAKDLHDDLGQLVTTLKYHLEDTQQKQVVPELLNQMNIQLRNISFALWPQVLVHDGLVQAIEELADRLNKSGKVSISVKSIGMEKRLTKLAEITLYRICQEWLNNILKYSQAKNITFQFINHQTEVMITVEDDGVGFDTAWLEQSRGNGWKNIRSRANLINAEIEADSHEGQAGTIFSIAIPNQNLFITTPETTVHETH
jgi:two-component system, NarL family, sensor kinase